MNVDLYNENTIAFCDLNRSLRPIRSDIDAALKRVLDSGWFLRGSEVTAFEEEWAAFCGQAFCVACNSGTDALTLAAMAAGFDIAEIQANTLPLTAVGLKRAGCKIDVLEINADGRLKEITPRSVPVLLYGRAPSPIENEARLFDAAHAHGWKPPHHAIACWSFYPTKSLGALGDAGAVTTNDKYLADEMRDLSGRDDDLYQDRQITSRMDEMQATVLRVKLRHLERWIADRRRIASLYTTTLPQHVEIVSTSPDDFHHLFVVKSETRDDLAAHLREKRIMTKVHFPTPLHRQRASWGNAQAKFPQVDRWCETVLSLPCYPGLTDSELNRICEEISQFRPKDLDYRRRALNTFD